MSRRKRKKRRGVLGRREQPARRRSRKDLQAAFDRVDTLILKGRAQKAVELLEPFLETYPREAELHYYLGYARAKAGDTWSAISSYERAQELGDSSYWLPLGSLCLEVGLQVHALRAFRQAIRHQGDFPPIGDAPGIVAALEEDLTELAHSLNLPPERAEKGLYQMERGRRALAENDFSASIAASRQAIQLLGDWPPSHNNLSLALFWSGQPEEAIASARRVLRHDPNNYHALSNSIRYLAWTGREDEAREPWARLKAIPISDDDTRHKIVEAAAVLDEDEFVYRALRPLAGTGFDAARTRGALELTVQEQYFLAAAEANTGRRGGGARRGGGGAKDRPGPKKMRNAREAGPPGPGGAERFPYFYSVDLLPKSEIEKLVALSQRRDDLPARRFESEMKRFVSRFPQVIRMAEKLLIEEGRPDAGIDILMVIGTPEAYRALRRFGQSQLADDDTRLQALTRLLEAGEISEDETLRVWLDGEWREVQLRAYEVQEEDEEYSPEVAELVNQGIEAHQKGDYDLAERLLQKALKLDPGVKQAYNNLGAIHAHREEHDRAKEMFQKALELDPLYPIPRCNLAAYLLQDGDVEGAEAMLEPLADAPPHHAQDIAFYSYTRARILFRKEEYDATRWALRAALKASPDYQLAKDLLERLNRVIPLLKGFDSLIQRQRERNQAKRARMQAKLTTPEPTLSEALSVCTKDALTGMARAVLPPGGWTTLRKAELLQEIVEALRDPDTLKLVVGQLSDDERAALRQVLKEGGTMVWKDFDARYGNDLEESPYWNWHVSETTMGCLRLRGLLAEATVDRKRLVTIPSELRPLLKKVLD
ncbi:MAG: tetratricopeptide repeat protein [Anaerolineales bacterium]|nr:MAG: tetratricopeptide repeat protein [Anaerolineales bacterium]